jgi:DNA-binding transcriptional LysR family regulator
MIDPRRLLTFRAVARRRSFSGAADELALTQPAVSQQIRALETQLGQRLIERGPGGFALTPTGEVLLAHADGVWQRLQLAETQIAEAADANARRLQLGAFPSALATWIPGAIARVHARRPQLEVAVVQGSTDEVVAGVRAGELHLALCFQDLALPREEHPDTRRDDLLEEPMLAAVGPGHRLAGRVRVRLGELADDPWIAALPDGLIHRACVTAGFEPQLVYMTADPLAIGALVARDLAVTLVSPSLARMLRGIRTLGVRGTAPSRGVYAVTPTGRAHQLVEPFLDAVRREAARVSAA